MTNQPTTLAAHRSTTLCALFVVALNLRPALAALGPVLESLRADLALSHSQAGLLTTVPIVCMGLFAPLALRMQARLGLKKAIFIATVIIGFASALRLYRSFTMLLLSSLFIGAATAVLGPLVNAFIKQHFVAQGARITALVTTALCLGAALAAGSTAILSALLSWPAALSIWGLLAFLGAAVWQGAAVRSDKVVTAEHTSLPWRSARSWQLLLTFGLNSFVFYGLLAWLAPAYQDYGLSSKTAGHLLAVFALLQIVGTLVVSRLSARPVDRRPAMLVCGAATLLGVLLTWQVPLLAPYVWMCLLGVGTAGLFALNLILPLDYSQSAAEAGAWTAMMCSGGYVIAAAGPLLAGWVRDRSGDYHQTFLLLATVSCLTLLSILNLAPAKLPTTASS